jgi:acetylornithine deacetylase/succinyl-diaminopimelate desuccinylase-like protein
MDTKTGEVTELLQALIRNRCVNDGTPESGEELRSADTISAYLDGVGLDVERYESRPGRASLVTRIEGSDPEAPSLLLLGHTDVVPVNEDRWSRDPFGAELVDGVVWGRGAVDMLNLTSSMAVAMRRLAESGFAPRGTLVYAAVADEESNGTWGAQHLATAETDAVRTDYMITESGGFPISLGGPVSVPVLVSEKGTMGARLRVSGTPGHGSMPFGADNALVKAGEVVRRLGAYEPATQISEQWRAFVEAFGMPEEMARPLLTEENFAQTCAGLGAIGKLAHACTHTTLTPTVMRGGSKRNVIPDSVEIELDVRTLPGDGPEEVAAMLREALGELADEVAFEPGTTIPASGSPAGTPLWDAIERVTHHYYEGAPMVPVGMPGATDARHLRPLGATCYGFGMFSTELPLEELATMAHGHDERIDVESLRMVADMWERLARDFLG